MLAVPIHGAEDEVLELPKDQLPDDPNEIMQILANELAPLKLWLELAVSYYQQQRIDQFTVVMETSTGEEGPLALPSLVPWRLVPPFANPPRATLCQSAGLPSGRECSACARGRISCASCCIVLEFLRPCALTRADLFPPAPAVRPLLPGLLQGR